MPAMRRDLVGIGLARARARTQARITVTVLDLEREIPTIRACALQRWKRPVFWASPYPSY